MTLEQAIYNLADVLRDKATKACANDDIDKIHYFVQQSRKIERMQYEISKRFPENNT